MVKVLFDPLMGPEQQQSLQVRVDLGSNGNEAVLHIPQSSRTAAPPFDHLMSYLRYLLILPLSRDAIRIFYRSS